MNILPLFEDGGGATRKYSWYSRENHSLTTKVVETMLTITADWLSAEVIWPSNG